MEKEAIWNTRMKILLTAINAKYIHSNLAVYCLKSYAEKYMDKAANVEIEIAEFTINQQEDEILRGIYKSKPDVLLFSCYIWNIETVKHLIKAYSKIQPQVPIILGGPEVSYNATEFLKNNKEINAIMRGEGEEIFKNVVNAFVKENNSNINWAEINGVTYRKDTADEIIANEDQSPINMSDIPFVYEDLTEFENRIMYYETSRGCPFSCSYCLSSIDKHLRFRDINLVKRELKFFIDNKVAQVKFVDRTFNCKKEHAMEIWNFIKENDNGITNFHFEIAADLMTDEEIDLIKDMRPGLIQLEIGVQSTNDKTIEAINRKTNLEQIKTKVEKIKAAGNVHQHLDLIAGLPHEDYKTFAKSFNEVYEMQPDQLQLGFLKVLHGSAMENRRDEYEIKHGDRPPYEVLTTKWLTYDDVLRLKEIEEVVEIYYNSFQFQNSVAYILEQFDSPFEMYEQLGKYYRLHSPNGEKHSRISRYNLLLEFAKEIEEIDVDILKEKLTLDVYLRENIKTRPEFARDTGKYKDVFRKIYESDKVRQHLPEYEDYDSKQLAKMTHIEVMEKSEGKLAFILFNYRDRNPLNNQAKTIDVTYLSD